MEDVLAVRDEYRLQGWAEIIRERQASGLTNKEFCAQRGITEKTYYYWLRKVREAAAETVAPQLVRLEERGEGERAHRIEIRYGEAELKLPEDVDLRAVSVLLEALRSHDCSEPGNKLLRGLRVHGLAAGDRRSFGACDDAVRIGLTGGQLVPVLRTANGPDQGAVLGGRRLCSVV